MSKKSFTFLIFLLFRGFNISGVTERFSAVGLYCRLLYFVGRIMNLKGIDLNDETAAGAIKSTVNANQRKH